jgi:exonuclease III
MAFKAGQSGNPNGRPKGSINNKTRWLKVLEFHADELIEQAIELAKSGDANILRFCLERIIPKAKDSPINLTLPKELGQPKSLLETGDAILKGVAIQEITPDQAKSLMNVITAYRDTALMDKLFQEINKLKSLVQSEKIS